jgi:predicted aminopeptidase
LALLAQGCATAGYTAQAIAGGARVLLARRSIDALLADPKTSPALAERLARVREITAFAEHELALPAGSSFRHYADLGRPYAVWTVVAAPELSVEPLSWCFPVAGCVTYRGYFSPDAAARFADRLRRQGYDVSVGEVTTYSTLGWFADPVLNTYVFSPDADLAGLLFHELAHQVAYAKDDTDFNESFATAVERVGVERWLAAHADAATVAAYRERQRRADQLADLALACRERLAALYALPLDADTKRSEKQRLLAELVDDISSRRAAWGDGGPDLWLGPTPNNATLAALGAYRRWTPAWLALLAETGSLPGFYTAAQELAAVPAEQRQARLEELAAR